MATLRIATHLESTKIFMTAMTGASGTPGVAGYDLTHEFGLFHTTTITGLVGPFYGEAKDVSGNVLAYIYPIPMVDDTSTIDTTVEDETKLDAIAEDAATAAQESTKTRQGIFNKATIEAVVPGTVDYTVRNDADDADVGVIRYNITTGSKEVV